MTAMIHIVEVSPQDGLQNESTPVSTRGQGRTRPPGGSRWPHSYRGRLVRESEGGSADG